MKIHLKSIFGRAVSFLLAAVITVSMLAVGTFATSAASALTATIDTDASVTLYDNDGDEYYEIYTADDLYAFSTLVYGGNTSINAKLMNDIVFNEGVMTADSTDARVWSPIGRSNSNVYNGSFDGNNKTVSGLYYTGTSSTYKALVGYLGTDGEVKNVSVANSYIYGGNYDGAIVGYNKGTVAGCHCINSIIKGAQYVGGIVGYNNLGTITDCTSSGSISGTGSYIGGITGYNYSSAVVSNCNNSATVTGSGSSKYVGGIAGGNNASDVSNCYNTGEVTSYQYTGGIIGYNYSGSTVTDCYNTASITGTYYYTGGIIGNNNGSSTVVSVCYNTGAIKGTLYVGGISGYNTTNAKINNCYNTNSVTGTGRYCGGIAGSNYDSASIANSYSLGTVSDTATTTGAISGNNGYNATIENCYYLEGAHEGGITSSDSEGSAEVKTAEQFASGEIAYLLQASQTTEIWGQTLGTDPTPLLFDDKVYKTNLTCADDSPLGYSNILDPQHNYVSVVTPSTTFDYGYTTHTCSVCGDSYIDSYTAPTNVSGDSRLFDKAASTEPYIYPYKSSYMIDEAVFVTAGNGTWVGLYPADVTTPASLTDAIYTFNLDSSNAQTFDIRTGTYNADNTQGTPAYLSNDTYNLFLFTDEGFTVGAQATVDIEFGNIDSADDNTYLSTNRKVYSYGDEIVVNAMATGNTDAWVGVYPKNADTATTPAEYILYIGTGYTTNYNGTNANLFDNSVVNAGILLEIGEYDIRLLSEKSTTAATILAEVTITVSAGFITTDKDVYGFGERIIAKANHYDSANIDEINNSLTIAGDDVTFRDSPSTYGTRIGAFPLNTVVTAVGVSGTDTNNWAYVYYNNKTGYVSPYINASTGSDVKIYGKLKTAASLYSSASTSSKLADFPEGTAYNYLKYQSTSYILVQIGGYTGYLNRSSITDYSKFSIEYCARENADVNTVDDNAWVGLYDNGVVPSVDIPRDAWYYLSAFPNNAVVLQDLASGDGTTYAGSAVLEVGEYTLNLFGDSDYANLVANKNFTVSEDVTGSFKNGAYKIIDLNDGFANGSVALELSDDSLGYIGTGEAVLYWADAQGNPLEDYTVLAKQNINTSIITFDMYPHTVIPEDAQSLVAYVSYDGIQGDTGYVIPFPNGTATYEGLDEGILSEFQIVSDLHITSDAASTANASYQAMLADIIANSPSSAGLFVNGDIADTGLSAEYNQVKSMNTLAGTVPSMYVTMGDQDAYSGNITNYVEFATSLGADVSADKPYYSTTVNGYKYIFLAGDVAGYYGSENTELSTTQLEWLGAELSDNEKNNAGKPVFIMMHQPVANSVAGSFTGQWASDKGVSNAEELKAVVSKYNNVFLLSGHSHYDLNCEGNHNPGDENLPVTLNTSAVSFLRTNDGTVSGSQGFYVRVYEDKVMFLGRDFASNKWLPSACYIFYNDDVSAKYDKKVLPLGEKLDSSEYITNIKGRTLTFESSDSSIVTVDENGHVSAISKGEAIITVTADATDTEVITRRKIRVVVPVTTTATITYLYNDRSGNEQTYKVVHNLSDDEILGFEGNSFTPYAPAHISGEGWVNSVLVNAPYIIAITDDIAWAINSDTYNIDTFTLKATQTDRLFTITSQVGEGVEINQKTYGELLAIDARHLDEDVSATGFWYNDTDDDGKYTHGTDLMLTYGPRFAYRITCDMNINYQETDKYDYNITIDSPAYGRSLTTGTDGTVTDKVTVDYMINILTPYFYGNNSIFVPSDDVTDDPAGQHVTVESLRNAGYTVNFGVILEQVGSFAPGSTAYPTFEDALTAAKGVNYGTATSSQVLTDEVINGYTAPVKTSVGTYCTVYDCSDYNITNKNRFGFTLGFKNTAANHKKFFNVYSYVTVTTPEKVTTTYISNVQTLNIYTTGTASN